jgi:hypothetical protein
MPILIVIPSPSLGVASPTTAFVSDGTCTLDLVLLMSANGGPTVYWTQITTFGPTQFDLLSPPTYFESLLFHTKYGQ